MNTCSAEKLVELETPPALRGRAVLRQSRSFQADISPTERVAGLDRTSKTLNPHPDKRGHDTKSTSQKQNKEAQQRWIREDIQNLETTCNFPTYPNHRGADGRYSKEPEGGPKTGESYEGLKISSIACTTQSPFWVQSHVRIQEGWPG